MSHQLLEDTFHRMDLDRELAFKFFVIFSMFEHALKEAGFRRVGQGDAVEADWTSFAQSIAGGFNSNSNAELSSAVSYLMTNPAKKQVLKNNQLAFAQTQRPPNISDAEWLSILIRRVRNNLFHGGKVKYDRHRDTLLIQFSIIILESWVVLSPNVQQAIWNIH